MRRELVPTPVLVLEPQCGSCSAEGPLPSFQAGIGQMAPTRGGRHVPAFGASLKVGMSKVGSAQKPGPPHPHKCVCVWGRGGCDVPFFTCAVCGEKEDYYYYFSFL